MRKALIGVTLLIVGLVLLGLLVNAEVPTALVFGWIFFLARVLSRMSVDGPTVAVSAG